MSRYSLMLASLAERMVYIDPNRLSQATIRERSMKNLFSIIGVVVVVVKKGYEFSHEYNEMKQELDKRVSDSP
ncbi:hypothetical protein [Pseudomonas putida]|uniref:hypothetical protein n=1 Tax=Pseudomonas putida TaxID=303 RepID=UPI00107521EA|nr:hypothetical protein [Pseudomonas putida]MCG3644862.1 hypothetical protein [Pseudomonas putida]TFW21809.1 hypothetical protein E4L40_17865 [Pseudomonas putida]